MTTETMRDWAHLYASHGWPVVPLRNVTNGDARRRHRVRGTTTGTHPLRAVHLATTAGETIDDWWHRWPNAAVGLATGHTVDALVIDGNAGRRHYLGTAPAGADPGTSGPIILGNDRASILFATTGQRTRTNVAGRTGLHYRGPGGYVTAPPSTDEHGRPIRWDKTARRWSEPLPNPPDWIVELAAGRRSTLAASPLRTARGER